MSYTEFRFYRDGWYPVGREINIPNCNLKTLWAKKNLTAEEVLGFYMVYCKNCCDFDSYARAIVRDNSVSVESREMTYSGYLGEYFLRGSLFVQAQNSLINISEAFTSKAREDLYSHMSVRVNMTIGGGNTEDLWTVNSIFRSPGFKADTPNFFRTEERILPSFSRYEHYFKECLIGFSVMKRSSHGLVSLSQIVNSITVNGKEFPFKVALEKDENGKLWYEGIDPNFFCGDNIKPIPAVILAKKD